MPATVVDGRSWRLIVQVLFAFAPFLTCILVGIHVYQVAMVPGESHHDH